MNVIKNKLEIDFHRDIYWGTIYFISDDEKKKSKIFISASLEYFNDTLGLREPSSKQLEDFLNNVIEKWKVLSEDIFKQNLHYDVYSSSNIGEANQLNFLIKKAQS